MVSTGIVRNIDDLGRVVLPIELRRSLGIAEKGVQIEIFVDDSSGSIVLKKFLKQCSHCKTQDNLVQISESPHASCVKNACPKWQTAKGRSHCHE